MNELKSETGFSDVVAEVQSLLEPVYQSIAEQRSYPLKWLPDDF